MRTGTSTTLVSKEKENPVMKNEFTYVELSDEQLELVVGGAGGIRQTGIAPNVVGNFATNLQNANHKNQVALININVTSQNIIFIITYKLTLRLTLPSLNK